MPYNDILSRRDDLKKSPYYHVILLKGTGFEDCKNKVLSFFQKYQLVRYYQIKILDKESLPSSNRDFLEKVEKAITKNRQILHELVKEFMEENITTIKDLYMLPQGYKTKLLHVITHFLDGFFGIDTFFYNLVEDSHWVSDELKEKIKNNSYLFWLIYLEAII